MITPPKISCLMLDVIRTTLATCDRDKCTSSCMDYLMNTGFLCPNIFQDDEVYDRLWSSLLLICSMQDVQTSFNPFQSLDH